MTPPMKSEKLTCARPPRTVRERLFNPFVVEPPHGRRKARIYCQALGCRNHIICTRLLCDDCWRRVPLKLRKEHRQLWRQFKSYTPGDEEELKRMAGAAINENCLECIEAVDELMAGEKAL